MYKSNLLAKISLIMPNESSEAKGAVELLRAYSWSSRLKEKARQERQMLKKGVKEIISHKKKLKGMYDDDLVS